MIVAEADRRCSTVRAVLADRIEIEVITAANAAQRRSAVALHVRHQTTCIGTVALVAVRVPVERHRDVHTACKARTVGAESDHTSGRQFVAASAGALFGKSHALAEEVHMAMLARGYTGNVRTVAPTRIAMRDLVWITASVGAAILVLGGDRVLGR